MDLFREFIIAIDGTVATIQWRWGLPLGAHWSRRSTRPNLDPNRSPWDRLTFHERMIVCLAPLTPRTHRMLGQRELGLIRSGAAPVNVSRGAIIDPAALIERLERGDITAALDVFDPEPIPADSRIRNLPNVFLSPHIAGVTAAGDPRSFELMVDELERFFHGHETRFDLTPRVRANRRGA